MSQPAFLIVGQGLAGTALAFHFLENKIGFLISDVPREQTSSKVAAGLINPITGRRLAKTWLADELFPYAKQFYQRAEQRLESSFYHERPVYRYFGSVDDENTWMGKSADPSMKKYIGEIVPAETRNIKNPYGGVHILQGGYLDTRAYLKQSRAFFDREDLLLTAEVRVNENGEMIGLPLDVKPQQVIFCEGYRVVDNPLFGQLPLTYTKGELINVRMNGISPDVIHSRGGFIVAVGDDRFRVGSTYKWNDLNTEPTSSAREDLKRKLHSFTDISYEIEGQEAAVRPTVKDRRPLIGTHPDHDHLHIFNGMGSKGVTLTPFLALHFYKHLTQEVPLMPEVDIRRFM